MSLLRPLLCWCLLVTSLVSAHPTVPTEDTIDSGTPISWSQLLSTLPRDSIRAAIEANLRPKYRHGIFEHEHDAIAAVNNDDPTLASMLLEVARQDAITKDALRKRQDNNATTTLTETTTAPVSLTTATATQTVTQQSSATSASRTTSPTPTSEPSSEPTVSPPPPPPPPTTQTGVLIPVEITASDGSVVVTSAFETAAPTTIVVPVTTTNAAGEAITTSSMAGAAIVSSTDAQGSVVVTASPLPNVAVAPGGVIVASAAEVITTTDSRGDQVVLSKPTPGGVYTTKNTRGGVVTITYQPGGGTVSQLRLLTSTLPDGRRQTITSFAEVGAPTQAAAGSGPAEPSSTEQPGLQSGAVTSSSWAAASFAVLIGSALAVLVLL